MRLLFLLSFTIFLRICSFSQNSDAYVKSQLKHQEWVPFYDRDSTVKFYINFHRSKKLSSNKRKTVIQTWIKEVNQKFTYHGNDYDDASMIFLIEISCKTDEMRIIQTYTYDKNGAVIFGGKLTFPNNEWQTIIPSSTGDEWKGATCSLSKYL